MAYHKHSKDIDPDMLIRAYTDGLSFRQMAKSFNTTRMNCWRKLHRLRQESAKGLGLSNNMDSSPNVPVTNSNELHEFLKGWNVA